MEPKKLTAILIGAGARGRRGYAPYAKLYPTELEFVGVAEPNAKRREQFVAEHPAAAKLAFDNWEALLEGPKLADLAFICTQDKMHYEPAKAAIEKGYDVFIEKPISPDPKECYELKQLAERHGVSTAVGHVLRYTSFFGKLHSLLRSGVIGKVLSIQHNENVGHVHMSHSFVRGYWRNEKASSPMILAKSCHDMDIITWLLGEPCQSLSSFGSLSYFRSENAPAGAPKNCLEGCPVQNRCPYYAPRLYMGPSKPWSRHIGIEDLSLEEQRKFLQNSSYGSCVFHSDNDVVDHQVVNMEFPSGATVAFTMSAFTSEITRTIKIMGSKGLIHGAMEKNSIVIEHFADNLRTELDLSNLQTSGYSGHGDGDINLVRDFVAHCRDKDRVPALTPIGDSMMSHFMAFAAEQARRERRVVDISDYIASIQKQ